MSNKPNIVCIIMDDTNFNNIGCYGGKVLTPNLDKIAKQGVKFTQAYCTASVCTASREGLLTGRLPLRSGMCIDLSRVLFPDSSGGLPEKVPTDQSSES